MVRTDNLVGELNAIQREDDTYGDNNLNAKLQIKYDDLIEDLDGIQRKDLEWFLKRYRIHNENTFDTKLEWILKRYRVDNDNNNHYDDICRSVC